MKVLHPNALRLGADHQRTVHHIDVQNDPEITIEDVAKPGFWKHHAARIRSGDLIDVIGNGFDISLRVTGGGLGYVETRLLRLWQDETQSASAGQPDTADDVPEGYIVDFHSKTLHRVRIKPEGTEISRNHKTREEAIASARAHHAKTLGVAA